MDKMLDVPQLSNEMQLKIMEKVKSGELSIEDALNKARKDKLSFLRKNFDWEEIQALQYNFSVYKLNTYRWQKRVFQVDFNTRMLCCIEKGIVKRQFPFADVKNCHDASGTRFSISFKDHSDYELEASSPQDKQKMLGLINQIIYRNINPVDIYAKPNKHIALAERLHKGRLFLQRGGLASFKWKKYKGHLYTGHLNLISLSNSQDESETDTSDSPTLPLIIHFSDGNASVETNTTNDMFTLLTNKNVFHFRVPSSAHISQDSIRSKRDAWVKAINMQCADWKRKSQTEHVYEDLCLAQEPDEITRSSKADQAEQEPESNSEPVVVPPVPQPRNAHKTICTVYMPTSLFQIVSTQPETVSEIKPSSPLETKILLSEPAPKQVPETVSEIKLSSPLETKILLSGPATKQEPETVSEIKPSSPLETKILLSEPAPKLSHSPISSPVTSHRLIPPPPLPPLFPKKNDGHTKMERTKAFHWDVVTQDKIAKSLWAQRSPRDIEIDTTRLHEHFGVQGSGHVSNSESNNHVEIMLNAKIAHNFNIFLKSFPVQSKELKDKLFIVDEKEGGLSDEHIASLRRYVPTSDDIEKYKSYKGDVTELHVVDQYMMEMCNIAYLSTQLDLLLTLRELPISIQDLIPLINQKITMCRQLWGSASFVCVLEYLLTIGNYLNQHAGKEKAKGFRLASLTKLLQLRGNSKEFTLLHALVEQIMLHEPHLVMFFHELAEFEIVSGASIKGLTAEVDVVKNELQKVIQYRKTYKWKNFGTQQSKFSRDLKITIQKYEADLSQLTKKCDEMRKLYTDILLKFGEPMDLDSQELFGWVCQFISDFKRIHRGFMH